MSNGLRTDVGMTEKKLKPIREFISGQQVFTLATCGSDGPWCASCCFVLDADGMRLVFMSQQGTRHVQEFLQNERVAGSILPDRSAIGRIKGVQFAGRAMSCSSLSDGETLRDIYLKSFPFARVMKGDFFAVMLDTVKMTDNTLGFGSKLRWERETIIIP